MPAVPALRRLLAGLLLLASLPVLGAVHSEPLGPDLALHSTPDRCPPQTEHQCLACSVLRHAGPPAFVAPFEPDPVTSRLAGSVWTDERHQFVFTVTLGRAPPALL